MTSCYQSMLNGGPFHAPDAECIARTSFIAGKLQTLHQIAPFDLPARDAVLKEMLLSYQGGAFIHGSIDMEYGHIELGRGTYINTQCMFMDNGRITLGSNVQIGPRCIFITPSHAIEPGKRAQKDAEGFYIGGLGTTKPITVEDNVWIAANVTVLPGVTIGQNSVVGAGSVVTKSVPSGVLAAGNPCRVIRQL